MLIDVKESVLVIVVVCGLGLMIVVEFNDL